MSDPVELVPAGRSTLGRAIIAAGLVIAGAALLVLLLGVLANEEGSGATGTPTPAPIIFPTSPIR